MTLRVPVIDAPSAGQQPLAVPQARAPGIENFNKIGVAVENLGAEADQLATASYHLAVRQQSSEAENDALNKMIALRTEYVAKFGKDATDAHPQVLEAMEKIYNDAKTSIPSKQGQLLFESNAMRNKRIELSVIETHFATQRKAQRVADYKAAISTGTRDLANLAVSMDRDPLSTEVLKANISNRLLKLRGDIAQEAEDRGIDPASREAFIDKEMAGPVEGLLNGLMQSKHPELRDSFYQYAGYMPGGKQKTVYKVMNDIEIDQKVRGLMGGMKRYDAGGVGPTHEDDHGSIPAEEVRAAMAQISNDDPNYSAIQKRLDAEVAADDHRHLRAGNQLMDRVDKLGQKHGKGGAWEIPYATKEWSDLERLYPALAKTMETKEAAQARVKTRFTQEQERYRSTRARGSALEEIELKTDEQVKQLKYEDVAAMVRERSASASGNDIEAVWKRVQEWDKRDAISKGMSKIVQAGLKDAFGKDRGTAADLEPDARAYADDLYAASKEPGNKKLTEEDIRTAVAKKARSMAEDPNKKWYDFSRKSGLKGYKQGKHDEIIQIDGHKFNVTKNDWVD